MRTPGSESHKRLFDILRATFVGGILFLVPVVVLLVVLDKALGVSMKLVQPVAEAIPYRSLLGLPVPVFMAILSIVVFCQLAGLLARTLMARRFVGWLETNVLSNIPGYLFMKSVGENVAGVGSEKYSQVVTVRLDDAWQIGFLVERIGDGRVAVFVPDAPTPSSGTILILAEDRIQVLDVPVPAVLKWLRSLGLGSRELLGKTPSA
jgi:uncharacterized membrane protein